MEDSDEPPASGNLEKRVLKEGINIGTSSELKKELDKLKISNNGLFLYKAGLPALPGNFTRDSIISGILMQNPESLGQQLSFCASKQGKLKNSLTGEEPGKIFHEYPGVEIKGRGNLTTKYNACDTTALFLIGHDIYQKLTQDDTLAKNQKENIKQAVEYIKRHINEEGAFIEDPKFSDAKNYALKVTYWKDSSIYGRKTGEPSYPVVYTLAHIQNLRALKSALFSLKDDSLNNYINLMKKFLNQRLIDRENGTFYLAIDKKGVISTVSSDNLHALFYLDKEDISEKDLNVIVSSSKSLETDLGYRTLPKTEADSMFKDGYHSRTVWPFEQALINIGARKFGLSHVEEVSRRTLRHLNTNPEIFILSGEGSSKGGNDPQLWTIAARKSFENSEGIFP